MGPSLKDDEFEKEPEIIRKRKMEELTMSDTTNNWPDKPIEITDDEFSEFTKKYPLVVVDFWAPWCAPCRTLGPIVGDLAKDYQGKVVFGKMNTDENQGTATKFGLMSIPTLIFFKDGEPVDKAMGALPKQALEQKLNEHL